MRRLLLLAAFASLLAAGEASAQGERQRPANPCERLAGVERERCLVQEQERRERLGREDEQKPRDCDDLFGPAKEICLKRGGTVRAGADGKAAAGR